MYLLQDYSHCPTKQEGFKKLTINICKMTKRVILKLQKRQYYWLSWLYQSCQVITSHNFWNQKGSDFLFFWDKLDILKRPENVFQKSEKFHVRRQWKSSTTWFSCMCIACHLLQQTSLLKRTLRNRRNK